jgi:hypothetical protein
MDDALEKAERYRLLNEPKGAESICLDVLAIAPDNQKALTTLLLARTDQFEDQIKIKNPGPMAWRSPFPLTWRNFHFTLFIGKIFPT